MIDPLLIKALRDLRVQIIAWGVGMAFLLAITVAVFPSMRETYVTMQSQMPDAFLAFLGGGDLGTMEGWLAADFFGYVHLALAVFAILAGGAMIVGEERQGTLELLLAQPISRLRIVTIKMIGFTTALVCINVLIVVGLVIPARFVEEVEVSWRIINAVLVLIPFEIVVGLIACFLAQLFGNRVVGGSILAGWLVGSFILSGLSEMNQTLERLRPGYLTDYYQGGDALVGEIAWSYLWPLLFGMAVFAIANVLLFIRRDILVNGLVRMPKLHIGHLVHGRK